MTLEFTADHEDEGVALLIEQFKNKTFIEILVRALMAQVQELEVALFDLLLKRALDTAVGAQLDVIGKIVGQDRGIFDEVTYRTWIRGRVLVNRSSGTVDQIVELVNTLLPDGSSLVVTEYYPAAFQIEVTGTVPDWFGNALAPIILEAKAVGIAPHVKWFNGNAPFRFADVAGVPDLADPNGFGAGVFAAGSTGVGLATVVPSLDFGDANNSQYLGLI